MCIICWLLQTLMFYLFLLFNKIVFMAWNYFDIIQYHTYIYSSDFLNDVCVIFWPLVSSVVSATQPHHPPKKKSIQCLM